MNNFPSLPHPWEEVSLLVVSHFEEDHAHVRQILNHHNWIVRQSSTCAEALRCLRASSVQIVVCERDLLDGDWCTLLSSFDRLERPPLLIVVSNHADERLWAEVLNLGGHDVLQKPYDRNEVLRVIGLAWRNWKGRWKPELKALPAARTAGYWVG